MNESAKLEIITISPCHFVPHKATTVERSSSVSAINTSSSNHSHSNINISSTGAGGVGTVILQLLLKYCR
jgi:hypothetical protein